MKQVLFLNHLYFWFCFKFGPPSLYFIFGWWIYDEIMNIVLRIIRSLLLNVWSFFRFSWNLGPVNEILKILCHIYIFSLNPDRLSGSNDITSDKLNFRPDIRHFFSKKSGHQEFVSLLKQFVATLPW